MRAKIENKAQSIHLSGEITFAQVQKLQQQSQGFEFAPGSEVVVDFLGVTKVDSSALALCVSLKRNLLQTKSVIRYCNVPPAMLAIAESVGVASLFS